MKLRGVVLLVFLLAGGVSVARAQQSIDLASISGRVTDPSGAVVPGAQVVVRHVQTNVSSTAVTDADGRFRFPYLRIGPYELVVSLDGFEEARRELTLTAGAAFELPVTLALAKVSTGVTVVSEAPVLETARSQVATTVAVEEVRTIPLNGRNFLELALLVPGVSPTNVASTQLFPETSAVPGITLSVGSQRNFSNNFIVDGLSANDDAAGLSGITYSVDAIDQVQVITSGGQAELGRALGGYVNIVTKSGTNVPQGTAYTYVRDDRLNAANPLLRDKLPMNQVQYGGSLGGPIVASRTFYFANVERRNLDQTGLVTISPSDVAAINARLAEVGYSGAPVTTGLYDNPVRTTNVFGKMDHQVSGRQQLSVRYALYRAGAENSRGAGGLNAPSASSGLDNLDQSVSVSSTLILSPRTVLETRAQWARGDLEAPASDPIGPAVNIAGVAVFGTSSNSPTGRLNTTYQVVNNLSHHAGAHAVRVGLDVLYNRDRITFPRARRGSYTFSSLQNFLAGIYNNSGFTQTFGATDVSQSNPNVGVYAQDEWKIGSGLTFNLGLRYDLQFLETINTDTNNVSPRAGVVWSPFGSDRMLIRAGAGIYYDRVPLRALANALLSAGNTTDPSKLRQRAVTFSPAETGAPVFPAILADSVATTALVNFTTMDPNLENASSRQASVEVETALGRGATLGVGYQYLRGADLLMSINQNVPTCPPSGGNNGCRPNPAYANNNQYSSAGESTYHGLHLSLTQRPSSWGHYRISYTLSKAMNNVGEFFFSSPIDPLDLSKDWGRSDNDHRHRLSVSGAIRTSTEPASSFLEHLTHGFEVSGTLQAYSAPPFNITSGVTTVQGTAGRPMVNGVFIARNSGVGSPYVNLSVRISRTFKLADRARFEVLVEGFNLTNHQNVLTRNTNFGPGEYPSNPAPAFGRVTAVGEPRSFQIGARIRF